MTAVGKNDRTAIDHLRLIIERAERLNEEKKALGEDLSDVFREAKSNGFDVKTIKAVIKARKMEPAARRDSFALFELYMTSLGHSDGSLSDAAREFLDERYHPAAPEEPGVDQSTGSAKVGGASPAVPEEAPPAGKEWTVDDARRLGHEAGLGNRPVTSNPFPARDPRRAAWDEEWCKAAGSDGMEIPEFLRSPPKPAKPPKGDDAKPGGEK